MGQAITKTGAEVGDFSYETPCDAAGLPARVAIFADTARIRNQIADDLEGAGFRCVQGGDLSALLDGPITLLGDLVMIDCAPSFDGGLDARMLAALARLDMRVASAGAQMIVSTWIEALDDVFGALDQSGAQILVQPSRAERVVAVGRVMSRISRGRVREMDEQDRAALLRLSDQVDAIAQELDRISKMDANDPERLSASKSTFNADTGAAFSFAEHAKKVHAKKAPAKNAGAPALPEARFVRQMIAARQARAQFFDADLFADPAWDMLLDLTAAHAEGTRVSVTSLCIAAGVPATTALRWLNQMVESGIFDRVADENDRRRAFIELSENSANAMARYFAEVETPLAHAA